MIGMVGFLGTPLSPWQALQTSNLAPNSASAAFAGTAAAANAARTLKKVGRRLLAMFYTAIIRCPSPRDCSSARRPRDATSAPGPGTTRAQYQLGFFSGGYTGTAGTKPSRFGISTFGRVLAS